MMIVRSVFGEAVEYPTAKFCKFDYDTKFWVIYDEKNSPLVYVPNERYTIEHCKKDQ